MNKLLINTLGKLQWLVDASYTSAVVDAFSSRRKHLRVFKIHQHIYLNLQYFPTDTLSPTIIQLPVNTPIIASYFQETNVPFAKKNVTAFVGIIWLKLKRVNTPSKPCTASIIGGSSWMLQQLVSTSTVWSTVSKFQQWAAALTFAEFVK